MTRREQFDRVWAPYDPALELLPFNSKIAAGRLRRKMRRSYQFGTRTWVEMAALLHWALAEPHRG